MNLRTIKRAGFTSALVLATAGIASADNITAGTARVIAVNSTAGNSMSNVRTEVWYKAQLYVGRSYQVSAWAVNEDSAAVNINPLEIYNADGTTLATGTTSYGLALEGTPNDSDTGYPRATMIQPVASGIYRIRIVASAWPSSFVVNVLLRETTLFSPWFFVSSSGGYDGYHTIHNNTAQAVSVTLRAHNSTGASVGTATFSIPEAKLGRGAAWATGLLQMMPVRVAMEMLLSAAPMPAARLHQLGFINAVVPLSELAEAARGMAALIAANAPLSIRACRQLVHRVAGAGPTLSRAEAEAMFAGVYASNDAREGTAAFRERRKPRWTGT